MQFLNTFKVLLCKKDENKVSPFQDKGILVQIKLGLAWSILCHMKQVCFPTGGSCLHKLIGNSRGNRYGVKEELGMGTNKVWID